MSSGNSQVDSGKDALSIKHYYPLFEVQTSKATTEISMEGPQILQMQLCGDTISEYITEG